MSGGTLKIVFWCVFVGVVALTAYVAFLNRASEKVTVNVPAAAVIGALGVLVTLLFSVRAERISAEFPATLVFDAQELKPFDCAAFRAIRTYTSSGDPWGVEGMFAAALSADPNLVPPFGPELPGAVESRMWPQEKMGLDILLRRTVDIMSMTFGHSWRSKVTTFQLPDAGQLTEFVPVTQPPASGRAIERDQWSRLFAQPAVLHGVDPQPLIALGKLVLPPDTQLRDLSREGHAAGFSLVNPFVTAKVAFRHWNASGGLGRIHDLCHLPPITRTNVGDYVSKYRTLTWVVNLEAEFEPLRSGHPDMPNYKSWIETLFGELRRGLDAERRWRETVETYQFETLAHLPSPPYLPQEQSP